MKKIVEDKILYLIEIVLILLGLLCSAVVIQNNKSDALNRGNQILSRRENCHVLVHSKKNNLSKSISKVGTHFPGDSAPKLSNNFKYGQRVYAAEVADK